MAGTQSGRTPGARTEFDVDPFLARPLTARIATNGPTVRPTWFLWEDGAFWILTGPWARLLDLVRIDPAILGPDEARWDPRFRRYLHHDPIDTGTVWLRLRPDVLTAKDLSYTA